MLFLFFITGGLFGQSNKQIADSIVANAKLNNSDSLAIQIIHRDFFKYCYSKPEVARGLADASIELCDKRGDDFLMIRALLRHGIYYDIIGKKDSALLDYNKAYKIANKIDDIDGKASVYNNKGLIYWNSENYNEAMENYLSSLKIFEETDNKKSQANSLNNIGLLLKELKRYKESKNYHIRALKLRKSIEDTYGVGASYTNLSQVYSYIDYPDSTIYYSHKAFKIKEKIGDKRGLGIVYNNLGQEYNILKQFDSSEYYLKKADKIYDELKSKKLKATNSSALGSMYFNSGNFKQSIKYSEAALNFTSEDEIFTQFKIRRRLAYAYMNLNAYKNSVDNFDIALTLKDSIAKQNEVVATQEVFEKYQSAEKQKQILIQRAELAEQDLIIQKRNYQIYGLLGLALILGLIGYLFYNQQKLKNAQLQKENELKDALLKIETQNKLQEQRLRISRDLHDNIGAQLTFIISSIDNLKYGFDIKDEKLNTKLETISDFTSGTIYELRDTIWAMNKSEITFEDLQSRISNYIEKAHLYDSNIRFDFNVDDSVDVNKKFTSVEGMNIHRVVQEAIHNSLKYANATTIEVEVSKVVSNLVFKISDNGKGFDITNVKRGNGLNNMEKRVRSIGGEIVIISKENSGTEIIVTI
ncbi:tetratricopeptide repeat protein [Winogradskyella sp.]|uniref:tetratricopeptide repeat protein n=1 Tax=Winogradskyella sp. TaxID=1883156 RepID=UPI0025E2B604|nr:tetratricopeptide repeat protein [Winogradskyella sp.]